MTEPEHPSVPVARVGRPHGLRGEVTLLGSVLAADELLALGTLTWRNRRGETVPIVLTSVRGAGTRLIARFEGRDDRAAVEPLVNGELLADAASLPDPGEDTVYAFQLIGLEVRTEDGRSLGVLEEVLPVGPGAVYVVRGAREWMIPAVPEFVRSVDLAGRVVVVVPPAGIEEL